MLHLLKGGLYTSSIRETQRLHLLKIQVTASAGQIFSATFTRAQCSLVFDIWLGEDLQAGVDCYSQGSPLLPQRMNFQKSSKRGRTVILTKGEEEEEGGVEQHRPSSLQLQLESSSGSRIQLQLESSSGSKASRFSSPRLAPCGAVATPMHWSGLLFKRSKYEQANQMCQCGVFSS